MAHLLALFGGSIVGFALALTGGGGSTLAVPLLLFVVGVQDVHVAIGTSALAVAVNAYANLVVHARAGHVRWRAGLLFTCAGIAGAVAASELGKRVDGQSLTSLFALLMMVVAVLMLRPRKNPAAADPEHLVRHLKPRLLGTGFGAGTLAGFFGIGGGFLIVPGLVLAARMEIIAAIGTSLLGVGSFGLATALNYARSGFVNWPIALEFICGGIVGGWVGVTSARRLAQSRGALNKVFASMLIAVAAYMLLNSW
ncbi:MAG TPA: sulfite exporter TauE/SafE family protein [Salinisphaeraceae bacterium]|nr:sulfite exporter TauE/SafE family protein [Salinisphaeraceae bacterium]